MSRVVIVVLNLEMSSLLRFLSARILRTSDSVFSERGLTGASLESLSCAMNNLASVKSPLMHAIKTYEFNDTQNLPIALLSAEFVLRPALKFPYCIFPTH